jgi:hypothetical protein
MAFVKKPKLCQNAPAGYQQINGLVDNLDSLETEIELEHTGLDNTSDLPASTIDAGTFAGPESFSDSFAPIAGVHDSPLIPRGAAVVSVIITVTGPEAPQLYLREGCLQSLQVVDTGVLFFPVQGFASVWGKAVPYGSAVTPPLDVRVNPSAPGDQFGTGLIVRTFQLQDNDSVEEEMLPMELGFYLLCYGRR